MTARLVVRPAAEADIADAALWYEQRASGLGTEFLRALDVSFAEIARMPERFPVVCEDCRRALLRRFPYAVYFVASPGLVSVVACMHASRDPRQWEERVGENDR
jgi:plasmid stabilization system protein ParE